MRDDNIRIKRHFSIVGHGPDTVEIRHGVWNPVSYLLNDESKTGNLFSLLQRLDGTATPAALAREVGLPREQVEDVIDHLDNLGILESGPSNALDYYLNDIMSATLATFGVEEPLLRAPRSIILIGDTSITDQVGKLLREIDPEMEIAPADERATRIISDNDISWLFEGLDFHEKMQAFDSWKNSFVLLACTVINPLQCKVLNRIALEHGFPWMHAAIDGPFLLIGPTFVPRRSACYECFEQRIIMNLRNAASYVGYKEALVKHRIKHGVMPIEPMLRAILASHTAMEIVNFTKTSFSFVVGKALSIFLPTMEFTYNEVLRIPGCPSCSPLSERDDSELYFDMTTLMNGNKRAEETAPLLARG
jgi:bacteriocin biosynthesis cyclodehydratase domain-containing protein